MNDRPKVGMECVLGCVAWSHRSKGVRSPLCGSKSEFAICRIRPTICRSSSTQLQVRFEYESCCTAKSLRPLRSKIEGIIAQGGGEFDEHCPDNHELTRFWMVVQRRKTEREESQLPGAIIM